MKEFRARLIESTVYTLVGMAVCAILVAGGYGVWRVKRWVNWKFGYSSFVEQRFQALEKRVSELEKR
jgi:hypothetical protein